MRTHPVIIHFLLFFRYLSFFFRAKTIYDIDSPFVTDFIREVIEDRRRFYAFSLIYWVRKHLIKNKQELTVDDHGAGSLVASGQKRTVGHIAKHGAIGDRQGRQLFKMVHYYQPESILELGTSLGISTLYLALADRRRPVITVEGSEAIAQRAAENFYQLKFDNIAIINDTFDKALETFIKEQESLDFVYLDGDHRSGSSIRYFEQCLPHFHDQSIMVIADIYWSKEMQQAWNHINQHPRVRVAIDLFDFGVLFFDPAVRQKIELKLVPARYKPWRIGLLK